MRYLIELIHICIWYQSINADILSIVLLSGIGDKRGLREFGNDFIKGNV